MRSSKKYLFGAVALGVVMMCAAALLLFRLRGSTVVTSSENIASTEVFFYEQRDNRWGTAFLGDSDSTMKSSGCLVTCIAAAMQMSDFNTISSQDSGLDLRMDPGALNQYFSENHVYDSNGNLQWGQLEMLEGFQVEVMNVVSAEYIQSSLQKGRYPIVRVRMKGYGNFHYVLVTEARDGIFYCMDPLNAEMELVPLSEYSNRVYAMRCVYPGN